MKKIEYKDEDYNIEEEDLVKIKRKYWDIFTFEDEDGIEYYYRPLTKKEYYDTLVICTDQDGEFNNVEFEDTVVGIAVIAPTTLDIDNAKAGVISELAKEIVAKSGFEGGQEELSSKIIAYKTEMLEPLNQMMCYIKEAFPDISLDDLEDMPLDKIIWYFSRTDFILRVIKNQSIKILTPKEYMELNDLGINLDALDEEYDDEEIDEMDEMEDIPESTQHNGKRVTKAETDIGSGSAFDFPELREYDAFMKGKLF